VLAEDLKIAPKDKAAEAMGCMKGVLSNLMDEIRLSCSYYENQYGKSVDGFYLSGGSCRLAGLEGALEEAFDSKPDHWDAFNFFEGRFGANVDKDLLEREKDSFAVAVGLALR